MKPREVTDIHTRLLRCALEVEDCRAYWARAEAPGSSRATRAFTEYWFGARSLARVEVLLANMAVRFDTFPAALEVLHGWTDMSGETRRVICHWHLQLADPLYRAFTGSYLVHRRAGLRAEVARDLVVGWMGQYGEDRWTMATRIQFASKLLSASFSAGLVKSNRDPRPLVLPRVPDVALEYLLHLLREVEFEGTVIDNPYLASVGLAGPPLDDRLRALSSVAFSRQGSLTDFGWRYPNLRAWAEARVAPAHRQLVEATR